PLRALLNAGNRRGTSVPRCVGPTQTLVDFAIFCPKALAGIGALPDTVVDRSISIRMSRKRRDESAARFRIREATPRAKEIHDRLQAWSDASISRLESARPQIPSVLDDRAEEAWEPLLAIADLAGGDWPERARAAAAQLAGTDETDDEALAILLLRDVSAVFREHDVDRLSSADLASGLCEIEESPWGEMYGKALDARGLARRVKPFAIRPRTVRFSDGTTAKGYHREQFEDAFARYHSDVPNAPAQPFDDFDRHTVTTRMETGISPDSEPTHAAAENHRKPASVNGCVGVTDESAFEPFGPKDEAPLEPDWNEIDALRLEALRAGNEHDALTGKPPLPRPLIGDDLYPLYLAEAGNKGLITEDEFSRLYALQVFVGDGPDPERPPLDESLLCSPYDLPEEELEADELEAELW
ncbi:MAG TPA: DUF3631 domain-containing protein, partial [Candidatus Elarobacter sp.]|nr:DUF3631 domain-containing protein [Candidatus Elarobacter sp.]